MRKFLLIAISSLLTFTALPAQAVTPAELTNNTNLLSFASALSKSYTEHTKVYTDKAGFELLVITAKELYLPTPYTIKTSTQSVSIINPVYKNSSVTLKLVNSKVVITPVGFKIPKPIAPATNVKPVDKDRVKVILGITLTTLQEEITKQAKASTTKTSTKPITTTMLISALATIPLAADIVINNNADSSVKIFNSKLPKYYLTIKIVDGKLVSSYTGF
jgi:hypothetical protein